MRPRICLLVMAILLCSASVAAESMRCSNRIVTSGDPKAKVAKLCGKPAYTEQRTVYRSGIPRARSGDDLQASQVRTTSDRELAIHDRSVVEVLVDVWVYNPGRRRLMREIVFEDNRIVEVTTLGRGY